jgi:hypothetical protein
MAEQIFDAAVRYGLPLGVSGMPEGFSPSQWVTTAGLLEWGHLAERHRGSKDLGSARGRRNFLGRIQDRFLGVR